MNSPKFALKLCRRLNQIQRCAMATNKSTKRASVVARPELDFDFILDPANREAIRRNIKQRKHVGDIDKVNEHWNRIQEILNNKSEITEGELEALWNQFYQSASELPNTSHPDAPIGGEKACKLVEEVGVKPEFSAKPKLAEDIGLQYRSYRPLTVTGGDKAYALTGPLARIEEALVAYTRDKLSRISGMEELLVPDIVNADVTMGCGLVAEKELVYLISDPSNDANRFALSGTGEIGISNYLQGETLSDLPRKFFTVSKCYRPEATSGGKMNYGLYRVHEFTKVEMYGVTSNETGNESEELLHEFVGIQKDLYQGLGLHFRLMEMSTKELGAPAFHKYDIEAWMPGRAVYGEVSSASNCTDYQARRLQIRYTNKEGQTKFVHTVNATACATSRLLIALLETHHKPNWSLTLPKSLTDFISEGGRNPLKMTDNNERTDLNALWNEIRREKLTQ